MEENLCFDLGKEEDADEDDETEFDDFDCDDSLAGRIGWRG